MGGFVGPFTGGSLNVAASNFAKNYRNNALVGDILAPRCPMDRQTFQYVVHDRSAMRIDAQSLRSPGDEPQAIRSSFSTAPYFCKSHAYQAMIPFETEQYGLGFGFSEIAKATGQVMDKLMLDREIILQALIATAGNAPNGIALSGTSMWDNAASTPIQNVEQGKAVVRQSGVQANILILSDAAYVALQTNPQIIAKTVYKDSFSPFVSLDQLSTIFNIKCVLASAIQIDKNDNLSWVWGTEAILAYVQDVSNQTDISACKTFVWTAADKTVDGYGTIVEPAYPLSRKATLVSTDWYYDQRITAPETLFVFTNCCATPTYVAVPAPAPGY